jgi:hypothetical protein
MATQKIPLKYDHNRKSVRPLIPAAMGWDDPDPALGSENDDMENPSSMQRLAASKAYPWL